MAHSAELEFIIKPIVNYTKKSGGATKLIKELIHIESQRNISSSDEGDEGIMRGVSFAARISSEYINFHSPESTKCLNDLLEESLIKILQNPGSLKLNAKDVSALPKIEELVREIVEKIINLQDLPSDIKIIASENGKAAIKNGSTESLGVLMCGWFLLRFVNPAMVTPHQYGLVKSSEILVESQKDLTNVTKMMQKIAAGQLFREEYMTPINNTLETLREKLNDFFNQIANDLKPSDNNEDQFIELQANQVSDDDLGNFFSIFTTHSVTMLRSLANDETSSDRKLFHLLHNTLLYHLTYNVKYYIQVNLLLEDEKEYNPWLKLLVDVSFFFGIFF